MRPVVLLLIVAALGCNSSGCRGGQTSSDAGDPAAARVSFAKLTRCLLGAPLGEGETPAQRMRRIELDLVHAPAATGPAWPQRCATYVSELVEHAKAPKLSALRQRLELVVSSPSMYLSDDGGAALVDRLFEEAAKAGVTGHEGEVDVPVAPAPATIPGAADMVELGKSPGAVERVELAPSATVRFMLGGAEKEALYCALDSKAAPLDQARCNAVGRRVANGSVPLSSTKDEALYYWDDDPPSAWSLEGLQTQASFTESAYVYADGTVGDGVRARPRPNLVRVHPAKGKVQVAPITPPPGSRLLGFRAGVMVWKGPMRGTGKCPVVVQHTQPGPVPLAAETEPGEIPPDADEIEACRSGDVLALALLGKSAKVKHEGEPAHSVAMLFRTGKTWKKAVLGAAPFGKDVLTRTLTCSGDDATLTWLRADDRIGVVRCTPEGCETKLSEPIRAIGKTLGRRAVSLGDNVLYVRVARTEGPVTGVTDTVVMRLAPLADVAGAPERVVAPDQDHEGLPNIDQGLGLVAGDGAAVVLVHSGERVLGVRVDASGKVGGLAKAGP
jgi:hypothetical protein